MAPARNNLAGAFLRMTRCDGLIIRGYRSIIHSDGSIIEGY